MARYKKNQYIPPEAPLLYEDHGRPLTRRQFIRQGLMTGSAGILTGGMFGLFANPNLARANVAPDLDALAASIGCSLSTAGGGIPFICFDLAGGANLAGSNVLVGQGGGQMDLLSTAGYNKLGLPGDMLPGQNSSGVTLLNPSVLNDFVNNDLNLMFHADSAMLFGILEKAGAAIGNVDGCVIPARSDNDTANNPHNPLYALAMTGARGQVVDLIGSRSSDSGGNSMSPAMYIDPAFRPTKIDRFSDVTGLVDVGDLTAILEPQDVTAVMESIARVTHKKLNSVDTRLSNDAMIKNLVRCGYLKAADIANNFAGIPVDPEGDPDINDAVDTDIAGIFSQNELDNDREFSKTASVMKMVVNGFAAGGCITMGGYDYHTGDRRTGENRDLRAGRCIGACIDYARRKDKPLMVYVFSDGSLASNGMPDDTTSNGAGENLVLGGRGKGQWTGDNSSTACSFFLVFRPGSAPTLVGGRQIGRMSADGSVVTSASPAANNPNLLVNLVMLNYMALNGQVAPGSTSAFTDIFQNHGLGSTTSLDNLIAFGAL
jgi:hypothetical protein